MKCEREGEVLKNKLKNIPVYRISFCSKDVDMVDTFFLYKNSTSCVFMYKLCGCAQGKL